MLGDKGNWVYPQVKCLIKKALKGKQLRQSSHRYTLKVLQKQLKLSEKKIETEWKFFWSLDGDAVQTASAFADGSVYKTSAS